MFSVLVLIFVCWSICHLRLGIWSDFYLLKIFVSIACSYTKRHTAIILTAEESNKMHKHTQEIKSNPTVFIFLHGSGHLIQIFNTRRSIQFM